MKIKNELIKCPNCELQGRKTVLGEMINGVFVVQRPYMIKERRYDYTLVKGHNFEIICPNCKETVFKRKTTYGKI